jgi:ubiquinone/menaquinone biosynthesis C-methylase UbiE
MITADIYEQFLVSPLFQPFAEELITRLRPGIHESLIDVACGTGIVARLARRQMGSGARIVGVDGAPAMLAVARAIEPAIDWREGNAMALPVAADEHFSLLACNQGLQFFRDKPAAVLEMRRVLAPGGRLAIGTWRSLAELPLLRELHPFAEKHLGPVVDVRHNFGDADAIARLLADAGFLDVRVDSVSHDIRISDGPMFAQLNASSLVSIRAGKSMSDAQRDDVTGRIVNDSLPTIASYSRDDVLAFAISANIATARAPQTAT